MLGIVNGEIVKVTNENVQKEIDINTEVLGIVNSEKVKDEKLSYIILQCQVMMEAQIYA